MHDFWSDELNSNCIISWYNFHFRGVSSQKNHVVNTFHHSMLRSLLNPRNNQENDSSQFSLINLCLHEAESHAKPELTDFKWPVSSKSEPMLLFRKGKKRWNFPRIMDSSRVKCIKKYYTLKKFELWFNNVNELTSFGPDTCLGASVW